MTNDEITEAWRQALTSREGEALVLWLRRKVMEVPPMSLDTCAVHEHNGSRRLAATILGFAARPEHEPDERRDAAADLRHERERQAQRAPRVRPSRRRVS